MSQFVLSSAFRKSCVEERLLKLTNAILDNNGNVVEEVPSFIGPNTASQELADMMIENAIGVMPVPLGIVTNVCVDDVMFHVPFATEEPSVCAAASFGAKILGNIETTCTEPLQDVQIGVLNVSIEGEETFVKAIPYITTKLMMHLQSMHKRGGGVRGVYYYRTTSDLFVVLVRIDVRDALGANVVNSAAEFIMPLVEEYTCGKVLASIVSNYTDVRFAQARCNISVEKLSKVNGVEIAKNIEAMSKWAGEDIRRGTTHNKGIMNGIIAFALATGNDTRAIEASAHAHACTGGVYKPLCTFKYDEEEQKLCGNIEMPALFATVGGGTSHPVAQWSHALLSLNYPKKITAHVLNRIAASIGLIQNFAALRALVTEGIQAGHMNLHKKRLMRE